MKFLSLQSMYYLKVVLMGNTLHFANAPAQQVVDFGGKKSKSKCIVFSNGVPIQKHRPGTIKFRKCGEKINIDGRVSQNFRCLFS